MRTKVAYVATVDKIVDIEGKDAIKYVSLKDLGWSIIHNVISSPITEGDKVVYIEYDTYIKPSEPFEFLRIRTYSPKKDAFKLRAMKMAGLVSYGLICLPSVVSFFDKNLDINQKEDGFDLTEILGVYAIDDLEEVVKKPKFKNKWQYFVWKFFKKPFMKKSISNSDFPSGIGIKTDEVRIENKIKLFKELKGVPVYITEKVDGQSLTASYYKGKFYLASRNRLLYKNIIDKAIKELNSSTFNKQDNAYFKMACKYDLPKKLKTYIVKDFLNLKSESITIQGESAGPSIQGNKMGYEENCLKIFNVYDPILQKYFTRKTIEDFCKVSNLEMVKILDIKPFEFEDMKDIKKYSEGFYENGHVREGVVVRVDYSDKGFYEEKHISFKCINDKFAIKE